MNAARQGFGLLDIVVAIALAAILSLLVFQALQQTRRTVKKIQATVDVNSMLIHFRDRVYKDIQGSFIPQPPVKQQQQTPQAQPQQSQQVSEPTEDQTALHAFTLTPINISEKAEADHGSLIFVTTSSLNIYDAIYPRAVRVMYELKKNPDKKIWELSRFESPELDYNTFSNNAKSKPGIIILTNIIALELLCYTTKKQEKSQQKTTIESSDKKESTETTTEDANDSLAAVNTWNSDERRKDKKPQMPRLIKIKGSVRNENSNTPVDFSFIVPLEATASDGKKSMLDQLTDLFSGLQGTPQPQSDPQNPQKPQQPGRPLPLPMGRQ